MSQQSVVSIGGIDYDSHSGLAVSRQEIKLHKEVSRTRPVHASGVHGTQQRSTALNRRFVKKTVPARPTAPQKGSSIDVRRVVKRSPHISKFARSPEAAVVKRATPDIAPTTHPVVAKAAQASAPTPHAPHHVKPAAEPASSRDLKHAALGQALANAAPSPAHETKQPKRRAFNVAAASLGVLLLTGYFTYVNMPNLSVRVAAAQAGIDATYPEYRPVGYRLNGPVAYQDGQVSMKFASNSGPVAFSLNQSRSSWDSSALLEKYVDPRSDGKYATYNDGGLTIYTYGSDAAWVNGGILYTVEGSATLSNEQVRRIATSM